MDVQVCFGKHYQDDNELLAEMIEVGRDKSLTKDEGRRDVARLHLEKASLRMVGRFVHIE